MKEFTYLPKAGALNNIQSIWLKVAIITGIALLFFIFPLRSIASGQDISFKTRVYLEEIASDSVLMKFDNNFAVPISLRLILDLHNLDGNEEKVTVVVPGYAKGYILSKFRRTDPQKPYQCHYKWKIVLGDVSKQPDATFAYSFPFLKGHKYRISQGPDGHVSHQHFFAYDFVMPVGTPVTAAREGVIAFIKQDSDKGGPSKNFIEDANYISVYHSDGTMGNYFHLKKNGVVVREGQRVKKGDIIGYSGNTGFSNGAHLHFEVIRPGLENENNQSVAFLWEEQDDMNNLAGKKTPFRIAQPKM